MDARVRLTLQDLTPPGVENGGNVPGENTQLISLVLASDGAFAYIGSAYRPCPGAIGVVAADSSGHRTLDCPLAGEPTAQRIRGLALRGRNVSWQHSRVTHMARLR